MKGDEPNPFKPVGYTARRWRLPQAGQGALQTCSAGEPQPFQEGAEGIAGDNECDQIGR